MAHTKEEPAGVTAAKDSVDAPILAPSDDSPTPSEPWEIYSAKSELLQPRKLWRAMVSDLWKSRELAWQLSVRDFKSMYRQSMLGYVWVIIPPLVTMLMFTLLQAGGVFSVKELNVPYPIYVLVGTVIWQVFVDAITLPLRSISTNRALLTKINFPREALVISAVQLTVFNMGVRLAVLAPALALYQQSLEIGTALFPIGLFGVVLFGAFIGILLAPLGAMYQDVERGVALLLGFWMLISPVLFPLAKNGFAAEVMRFNPMTPLILVSRDWLAGVEPQCLPAFIGITLFSCVGILLGWVLLRVSMAHVTSRLGM